MDFDHSRYLEDRERLKNEFSVLGKCAERHTTSRAFPSKLCQSKYRWTTALIS
jgi:hypothetical protein